MPRHSPEGLTIYRVRAPITAAAVIVYEGKPAIGTRAGLTITILIDVSETMHWSRGWGKGDAKHTITQEKQRTGRVKARFLHYSSLRFHDYIILGYWGKRARSPPAPLDSQSTPVLVKMWEPVSLPFKSSSLPLPTLPTTDEIRSCSDILWERCYDKIVAVNDKVVIKFGGSVSVWEGQALIYLEKHVPQVSAPRLYAMYQESNQVFLVMQRIPGVRLDSIWPSLTPSEKDELLPNSARCSILCGKPSVPGPTFSEGWMAVVYITTYSTAKRRVIRSIWDLFMVELPLLRASLGIFEP
ncbi:phosphotransferase enzyme family protein [Histoplasma capsulatum var. duboisii H88]|uniref:Phosphotransferase enzyme family protein n=1 Tax=Ajellomyces capsulatus (strain H88) TaxID=544711 RepID=F0USK1_AJEC8|nr:phosphotransferase enzyme family protein [Histoplasma capsulatum var. duboisii H88]